MNKNHEMNHKQKLPKLNNLSKNILSKKNFNTTNHEVRKIRLNKNEIFTSYYTKVVRKSISIISEL